MTGASPSGRQPAPTTARAGAGWQLAFASATGVSHLRLGEGNEDACLVASRLDGALVLAAADGAGSARCAAAASELAVRRAVALACETPLPNGEAEWAGWLLELLAAVRSSLLAAVIADLKRAPAPADLRRRKHDYATTLLLCVLTPRWLACLQIGDGAIVVRIDSGLTRLCGPVRSEHAGETVFVTSDGYLAHARVALHPAAEVGAVALLTDGLEALALDLASGEPYAPFFDPLFAFATDPRKDGASKCRELLAFLQSDRVNARSHDDKTLVLAAAGT